VASTTFDYADIAERTKRALAGELTNAMIVTEEGFGGRVHVKIVSDHLDGMSEREKQELVWDILKRELASDAQAISFVLPYGADELP